MTDCSVPHGRAQHVRIGQIADDSAGELSIIGLGSCIGVVIAYTRTQRFAAAHVFLPKRARDCARADEGTFADEAVRNLIARLVRAGSNQRDLTATVCGGASMFSSMRAANGAVGERNIEAVRRQLTLAQIPIAAERVGGKKGLSMRVQRTGGAVEVHANETGGPSELLARI